MADICKLASSANVIQTAHLRLLGILPKTRNREQSSLANADKLHGVETGNMTECIRTQRGNDQEVNRRRNRKREDLHRIRITI